MITSCFSLHDSLKIVGYSSLFSFFLALLSLFLFSFQELSFAVEEKAFVEEKNNFPSFSSCFVKKEATTLSYFPSLPSQIEGVATIGRPDGKGKLLYSVVLKNGKEAKNCVEGATFYLNNKDSFSFSESNTPLWIVITKILPDEMEIEIGIESSEPENKISPDRIRLPIRKIPPSTSIAHPALLQLANGKFHGSDRYWAVYHPEQEPLYRIVLSQDTLLFRKENVLVYQNGQWDVAENKMDTTLYPIACIESVDKEKMVINCWDEKGTFFVLSLPISSTSDKIFLEEVLTQAKLRTAKQVSCLIENKRVLLKPGDFLVHHNGKWRVASTTKSKSKLRENGVEGEIFVFDSLVQKGKKRFLKGYLFNGFWSTAHEVSLPVNVPDKRIPHSEKKKKN